VKTGAVVVGNLDHHSGALDDRIDRPEPDDGRGKAAGLRAVFAVIIRPFLRRGDCNRKPLRLARIDCPGRPPCTGQIGFSICRSRRWTGRRGVFPRVGLDGKRIFAQRAELRGLLQPDVERRSLRGENGDVFFAERLQAGDGNGHFVFPGGQIRQRISAFRSTCGFENSAGIGVLRLHRRVREDEADGVGNCALNRAFVALTEGCCCKQDGKDCKCREAHGVFTPEFFSVAASMATEPPGGVSERPATKNDRLAPRA
jgi:hypothetical protein